MAAVARHARRTGGLLIGAMALALLTLPLGCQGPTPTTPGRPPAPSGRLTVTVRDEAGQPVAGQGVSVAQDQGHGLWGPATRLVTDTRGQAEAGSLAPGPYQVTLSDVLPLVIARIEVTSGHTTLALTRPNPPAP